MKRPLIVAAFVAGFWLAGCGAEDLSLTGLPPGEARLAVLNALPGEAVASLWLDGELIPLPQSGLRTSRSIAEGTHVLEARTGAGITAATASFAVGDGSRRTAILAGGDSPTSAAILITADTASIPQGDAGKLRLVHSVADAPALEGWLDGSLSCGNTAARLVSPFSYGMGLSQDSPGYVLRNAGQYLVTVTGLAQGDTLAQANLNLGPGQVWSVVLVRDGEGELTLVPIRER